MINSSKFKLSSFNPFSKEEEFNISYQIDGVDKTITIYNAENYISISHEETIDIIPNEVYVEKTLQGKEKLSDVIQGIMFSDFYKESWFNKKTAIAQRDIFNFVYFLFVLLNSIKNYLDDNKDSLVSQEEIQVITQEASVDI